MRQNLYSAKNLLPTKNNFDIIKKRIKQCYFGKQSTLKKKI